MSGRTGVGSPRRGRVGMRHGVIQRITFLTFVDLTEKGSHVYRPNGRVIGTLIIGENVCIAR